MLIPTRGYIPFFASLRVIGDENTYSHVLNSQDQFLTELALFLKTLHPEIKSVEVKDCDPPDDVRNYIAQKSWLSTLHSLCHFVEVETVVELDDNELKKYPEDMAHRQALFNEFAIDVVKAGLDAALLLSELSFPGCIHTLDGALVSDTHTNQLNSKGSFIELLIQEDQPHWPKLNSLSLIQALRWAQKIGFGEQAFALTRISKALASLTHVVGRGPHNDSEALFRAAQGLEAFYCDGVGDLRRQRRPPIFQ